MKTQNRYQSSSTHKLFKVRSNALLALAILSSAILAASSALPSTSAASPPHGQVTIETYCGGGPYSGGTQCNGFYTTLWANGTMLQSCFSPCGFSVDQAGNYEVAVSDYGSCSFTTWSDGTTNRFYPFTVASYGPSNLGPLYAEYSCSEGSAGTSGLQINTIDASGNPISGYYTVLNQSGNIQETGFTPTTFNLENGITYTVQVDNYGSCHFDHWQDTGSTTDGRTISILRDTSLTAVMNCGSGASGNTVVNVSTVNSAGSPISGYYIAVYSDESQQNLVQSCFSPCTLSLGIDSGQTYWMYADSYGNEQFTHWANNGSSGYYLISVPQSQPQDVTAVYSP